LREYKPARREPGQVVALVVAGLFVVAAVVDASPGVWDNVVHLAFGLSGLALSRRPRAARGFLIWGGVAYFLFWQFGTVVDPSLVPFHSTNAGVHVALVASMIGLAVLGSRDRTPQARARVEYTWDTPVGDVGRRPTSTRPPGRTDRRATRRPVALAHRA
jgi:hypothetical protein